MLVPIIHPYAEERFLEALAEIKKNPAVRHVLFCAFSQVPLAADLEALQPHLKNLLLERGGELYKFNDGDVAVLWHGSGQKVLNPLIDIFTDHYRKQLEPCDRAQIFRFFDMYAHGEALGQVISAKLQHREEAMEHTKPLDAAEQAADLDWIAPVFSEEPLRWLPRALVKREKREKPEFLIVEDQDFSRRLLAGLLMRSYHCHLARNAQEAVELYAEHAPDIAFLDIELPDVDGHTLAALFKKHDPKSFVVMVTGNHYAKDVEAAKANKVQGFIVKPFNKQKILGVVDTFLSARTEKR